MGNFYIKAKHLIKKNSIKITGAACAGNFIVGAGKLVMGVMSLSFFTCVSAFYTFGMVIAKLCAIKGMSKERSRQYDYYRMTGIILIIASILYTIYSARLLIRAEDTRYDIYVGITIATFTFTEIGLNVRGVIVERKNHELLFHALKMVSLASSLISLVLTQTALLSFTHEGVEDYNLSFANGAMGILMGSVSTMIGIFMMFRVKRIRTSGIETVDR